MKLKKLAKLARPQSDEDWGSDRQLEAENEFWNQLKVQLGDKAYNDLTGEIESSKMDVEKMIDYALSLYGEMNYIPHQHGKGFEITQSEADKLFAAGLEDTSWKNDICASFTLLQKHQCLRLWIEAKKFEDRESESKYRFIVSQYNADMDDHIGDLIETDSLNEALSCIKANQEDDTDVGICGQCGEQGQIRTTCRHCGRGIIEAINEG